MQAPRELTSAELTVLVSAADELIPPQGPWPAPSTTRLARYISDSATRPPDVASLRRTATFLRERSGDATAAVRVAALRELESTSPADFADLREFVTYGYYAQEEVVRVLQQELACDYHSPPQPVGYPMELDEGIVAPTRGSYTPTDRIERVDLSVLPPSEDRPWPSSAQQTTNQEA